MTGYLAGLAIVLLLGTVMTRVLLLRRAGTQAMHFGNIDKTDFLIPPVGFALVMVGQFLVFPNWVPLVYLAAGSVLFHR